MREHIGRETTLTANGKTYRLARFSIDTWDGFLKWAKTVIPDPIEVAKKAIVGLPEAMQNRIVDRAIAKAERGLTMDSPEITDLQNTPEGARKVIDLLLRQHQPELTERETWDIFEAAVEEIGIEGLKAKLAITAGSIPEDVLSKKKASRASR